MTKHRTWLLRACALLLAIGALVGLPSAAPAQADDEPGLPQSATPVPTVSGEARFGSTLAVEAGSWDPGVTLTYQWLHSGTPVAGATGSSYLLGAADVGAPMAVAVTGSRPLSETVTRVSEPTPAVLAGTLAPGTVRIGGTPRVGRGLLARPSGFDAGSAVAYRWRVGGAVVGRGSSLRLTKPMTGSRVVLEGTVTKAGYAPVTVVSAPTGTVKKKPHRRR